MFLQTTELQVVAPSADELALVMRFLRATVA